MRILLVIPPHSVRKRWGDLLKTGALYPSMGLAYIAAVAELEGHSVRVLDAQVLRLDYDDIESEIRKFNPHVLGMQTFYADMPGCYRVAKIAKSIDANIKVVLGGIQATHFPEEQLLNPDIDVVVRGEGEITFKELLRALERGNRLGEVDGISYKDSSNRIISNPARVLIADLDELPFPALHLFPIENYYSASYLRGSRTLPLFTSRGCVYNCSYCFSRCIFGGTLRLRSAEKVVQDMQKLISDFGVDCIQFYDEIFTINRKHVFRICDALDKAGINLPWSCLTRVDLADEELFLRMRDSRCYQIFFGVETGIPRLLELIRKGTTLDQARKAFALTRKLGIETVASFMLLLPTETPEETRESIRFGLELDPDYIAWFIFIPYPGAEIMDIVAKTGTIINNDPSAYNLVGQIIYVPEGRRIDEIRRSILTAYRKFYLRPKHILRRLNKVCRLPFRKKCNLINAGLRIFSKL